MRKYVRIQILNELLTFLSIDTYVPFSSCHSLERLNLLSFTKKLQLSP